eukprot:GILI01039302.1.p1 GENE.GILI01039302.1~~GILI01039302.1.p1  ORF type:complete len:420 (-),score=101.20 GILI01039302.1:71-1153(-)
MVALGKVLFFYGASASVLTANLQCSLLQAFFSASVYVGLHKSLQLPNAQYPFGWGRVSFVSLFGASIVMFVLGGLPNTVQGLESIFFNAPPPPSPATHMLAGAVMCAIQNVTGLVSLTAGAINSYMGEPDRGFSFTIKEDRERWKQALVQAWRDPIFKTLMVSDMVTLCCDLMTAGSLAHWGTGALDPYAQLAHGALFLGFSGKLIVDNYRYLLGRSIDPEMQEDIRRIILSRPSVNAVKSIDSYWISPTTFNYKAEVDFRGIFLAAKAIRPYEMNIMQIQDEGELRLALQTYATDITQIVEAEVEAIEANIRKKFPGAIYITLEPDSESSNIEALTSQAAHRISEETELIQRKYRVFDE